MMRCNKLNLQNVMMESRLKNLTVISALSYDTFVGFEAREVFDWERYFPTHMRCSNLHLQNAIMELRFKQLNDLRLGRFLIGIQSSPFCGKASPTSWGRVESASSSPTRCDYIPYSYSYSAYRTINLLLSRSKFPAYLKNR